MANLNLPMPGEEFDGGVVIASVWRNDDDTDGYPISALLLLLDENPDFYRVQHIEQQDGKRAEQQVLYIHDAVPGVLTDLEYCAVCHVEYPCETAQIFLPSTLPMPFPVSDENSPF